MQYGLILYYKSSRTQNIPSTVVFEQFGNVLLYRYYSLMQIY